MEFGLNEDQRLIEQTVRNYLGSAMPLEEIHRITDERSGFDATLWQGLMDLGVPGLLVPEAFGGAGLGMLEAEIVSEALGYAAATAPFTAACVMAPLAISLAGSTDQKVAWLPKIASGEMRTAVSCAALAGTTGAAELNLVDGKLSGHLTGLLDSGGATNLLIFLRDGRAVVCSIDAVGLEITPQPSLDRTRPLANLSFDRVTVEVLETTIDTARRVLDAGRLMLAADTMGAGQRMIEKAVDYAGERVQFGRVIGSYQAVKHMCAEMTVALEPCRGLLWFAAHAQDQDDDERRVLACLAKAHLAEVGRDVARTATEVHGGMGFTDLMGLHFWFKRISFDRQVLGGPERCRQEAAEIQGWA
jgi:alkylation response protein AidB-like acyl-CoA dehydrogenase